MRHLCPEHSGPSQCGQILRANQRGWMSDSSDTSCLPPGIPSRIVRAAGAEAACRAFQPLSGCNGSEGCNEWGDDRHREGCDGKDFCRHQAHDCLTALWPSVSSSQGGDSHQTEMSASHPNEFVSVSETCSLAAVRGVRCGVGTGYRARPTTLTRLAVPVVPTCSSCFKFSLRSVSVQPSNTDRRHNPCDRLV